VTTNPFKVGDVIEGYAGGLFGRDSYSDKRVEAVGPDWCVLRSLDPDHDYGRSERDRKHGSVFLIDADDFELAMGHKQGPKRCTACGHEEE